MKVDQMETILKTCLDDLSRQIDEKQEEQYRQAWRDFWEKGGDAAAWLAPSRRPAPPRTAWPEITVNQALEDSTAMLLQQFKLCSNVLAAGGNTALNVRCNYGTVIVPSLFDCRLHLMDEILDCLPGNHPLNAEQLDEALAQGVPDIYKNSGGKVFRTAERFLEVWENYPVLKRNIALYHPDLQGPIDNAETIWGSSIFYAIYDQPDKVRAMLRLITDTYIAMMDKWIALTGKPERYNYHWGMMHRGLAALRNDSLMNLSPQVYIDFVRPLDQEIFDRYGGGIVHYCGRGDHFVPAMSEMKGLYALTLSQPHLNNMDIILSHTVDKGIRILGLDLSLFETKRPLRGLVQVFMAKKG